MIDFGKLMKLELNAEEVTVLLELDKLAKKAKTISELIRRCYKKFGMFENEIIVYEGDENIEYLRHEGWWICSKLDNDNAVMCTDAGIFKLLRDNYFCSLNIESISAKSQANIKAAYNYFMKFVERTAHDNGFSLE